MAQFSETVDIKRPPEEVEVRVTRSEAPTLLEETQQGRTFARTVRYSLSPAADGTLLRLEDNIVFKGLGKLAAPIVSRDVRNRWASSLERLKAAVEAGGEPH